MTENDWLAEQFEADRSRLRGVAYRMLGSVTDAEDAVQEAWLRLSRSDTSSVQNLHGWLTTVVARISLDMLRSRKSRREDSLEERLPDPVVSRDDAPEPEQEAVLADSVGLAMLVVLDTLAPAERLAFVLHDMFAVPFAEIGQILDRSPDAAKQLASRARRRVQGAPVVPDADLPRQREVVDAFLAAARAGDFEALLTVLDPDVVLRADDGVLSVIRGAAQVAGRALMFQRYATEFTVRRALINGQPGVISFENGVPRSMLAFTVAGGRIVAMDALNDPDRMAGLDLSVLE